MGRTNTGSSFPDLWRLGGWAEQLRPRYRRFWLGGAASLWVGQQRPSKWRRRAEWLGRWIQLQGEQQQQQHLEQ